MASNASTGTHSQPINKQTNTHMHMLRSYLHNRHDQVRFQGRVHCQ
jgi:hypothetical protein